jgi:hypothetical protein
MVGCCTRIRPPGTRGQRYGLSASVGGTLYDSSQPESIEASLVKADALMYEQKPARKTHSAG